MIQTYIGEGLVSLAEKLQELWSFKKIETSENGELQLWLSEENYIGFKADMCRIVSVFARSHNIISTSDAAYQWKIVCTACGIAFGSDAYSEIYTFIGRTIRYDGVESVGCVARSYSTSNYAIFADSQSTYETLSYSYRFAKSDYYTQIYNVACASAPVYFPDIYFIACSPQDTTRITQIGADLYFCNEFIALRDTPAQTGTGGESVDLSNYYTAPQVDTKIRAVEQVIAGLESGLRGEIESVAADISVLQNTAQNMSRTFAATAEQEVRDALQFAAAHPGCYLDITLPAGMNVTLPTMYIFNATIKITGTQQNSINTNTITFEQTSTTSNLHFENTSLKLSNLDLVGDNATASASRGTLRAETGSYIYINKCRFRQAEGSQNLGCCVEARDAQGGLIANSEFGLSSTSANACGIYCSGNVLVTAKSCTFAADSTTQTIARLELGAHFGQLDTAYNVIRTANHGTVYRLNGVEQE